MKSFQIIPVAIIVAATIMVTRDSLAFSPSHGTAQRRHHTITLQAKHSQKAPAHHEKSWQPFFDRLTKYQNEHDGDLRDIMDDGELADWLEDQRKQYHLLKQGKKVRLTKKRAIVETTIAIKRYLCQ